MRRNVFRTVVYTFFSLYFPIFLAFFPKICYFFFCAMTKNNVCIQAAPREGGPVLKAARAAADHSLPSFFPETPRGASKEERLTP